MDCTIMKDLIPLYIDHCCSEEGAKLVEEHMESCSLCRKLYESLNTPCVEIPVDSAPKETKKFKFRGAAVLYAVLLFALSALVFFIISIWSAFIMGSILIFAFVIPAAGFLLSLVNWCFAGRYKSRKSFSNCSMLITVGITLCGFVWTVFYYDLLLVRLFQGAFMIFFIPGLVFAVFFSILSKLLSDKYKETLEKKRALHTECDAAFVSPQKIRSNGRNAAIMHSVLLVGSFAGIVFGVAAETSTPVGWTNSFWAFALVVPATGFFLSLANWYFIRLYKSSKSFSNCSMLLTVILTVCAYIATAFHYEIDLFSPIFSGIPFMDFIEMFWRFFVIFVVILNGPGLIVTIFFSVLSKLLSGRYAALLGKK